jgi:hypothetical protein
MKPVSLVHSPFKGIATMHLKVSGSTNRLLEHYCAVEEQEICKSTMSIAAWLPTEEELRKYLS